MPLNIKQRERYQKIIQVATELFLQNGFTKTSLEEIVQQVGGSLTTIYKYFGSKEGLLEEILRLKAEEFEQNFTRLLNNQKLSFREYMIEYGFQIHLLMIDGFFVQFFKLLVNEYDNSCVIREIHNKFQSRKSSHFLELIKKEFPHLEEEKAIAYASGFYALMRPDSFPIVIDKDKKQSHEAIRKRISLLADLFLNGLYQQ